jgi:arylsulfatase A-like enzyme
LIPANTVVEAGADVLDIYPTIVDAMGKTRPKDLQGKSLIPLILKETGDYPEPATATQYKLHYTMQMQEWKLYLRRGEYQLYDRKTDVTEQTDVSSKHPLASRWLLDSMGWFRAYRNQWDKQTWGAASNLRPEFVEAVRAAKRN